MSTEAAEGLDSQKASERHRRPWFTTRLVIFLLAVLAVIGIVSSLAWVLLRRVRGASGDAALQQLILSPLNEGAGWVAQRAYGRPVCHDLLCRAVLCRAACARAGAPHLSNCSA